MIDEFFAARILVFGYRDEFLTQRELVEIIDLIDPNFKKIVKTSWIERNRSFCGIVGNQPFFGGGQWDVIPMNNYSPTQNSLKDGMILNKKKEIIELETPRSYAASCKISQNSYLISGGCTHPFYPIFRGLFDADPVKTSEIIEFKPEEDKWIVRRGMDMPFKIWGHSAVKWDENTIYIIEGLFAKTWILDMEGGYREGPSLNIPRDDPYGVVESAIMISNGKRKIIVAHTDSVEILDPESSDEGWIQGNIYGTLGGPLALLIEICLNIQIPISSSPRHAANC